MCYNRYKFAVSSWKCAIPVRNSLRRFNLQQLRRRVVCFFTKKKKEFWWPFESFVWNVVVYFAIFSNNSIWWFTNLKRGDDRVTCVPCSISPKNSVAEREFYQSFAGSGRLASLQHWNGAPTHIESLRHLPRARRGWANDTGQWDIF
jgi:hypothetical protein